MPDTISSPCSTLHVELGERGYPIHIAPGLLVRAASGDPPFATGFGPLLANRQIAIVTNTTVAPLYIAALERWLQRETAAHGGLRGTPLRIELADGEFTKKLETIEALVGRLLDARFDRGALLIALGGGVVGDITGFAAAIYQRGIEFLQVPTTLLAQVDSSVGGKTGVNHPLGKNMIGAFHQPRGVLIDIDTLTTLPERERRAGIAEIIKYGLVFDADFFTWLEQRIDALAAIDPSVTREAILRSCEAKARVVALDEREGGARALLNLGHTFGHAIEAHMGYGNWLHGEAVGTGMAMAARLSGRLGWMAPDDVARAERLIARAGLALHPPEEMTVADFVERMAIDKKVANGRLRLVLLEGIGRGVVRADFDPQALEAELGAQANRSGAI